MLKSILLVLICTLNINALEYETPLGFSIIPEPQRIQAIEGETKCIYPIIKQTQVNEGPPESYTLTLSPKGTEITYRDNSGLFYAQQTLKQLKQQYTNKTLPCAIISDAPRYPWRGLLIDPPRHFYPIDEIKRFIRTMSSYKFNILHLRLNDDQGWRFPVSGYPKLLSIGSKRSETEGNKQPHRGFYTKEDLKSIVAYAAIHHVQVIPEIDTPGHNQALAAAYPEFICFPNPDLNVRTTAGISKELVCPANPKVWDFYQAVLIELAEIFPNDYIHLGGDEAPTDNWEQCPHCQELRERKKLASTKEQMQYFFSKINTLVQSHKKKGLFWFEEHSPYYPQDSMVYTWRLGKTPAVIEQTRKQKLKLICAPGEYAYLDYSYKQTSLEKAYQFNPSYNLPKAEHKHIQGVEATLWGERLATMDEVFQMAYPRAYAISEAAWSPMNVRSWQNFSRKVQSRKTP